MTPPRLTIVFDNHPGRPDLRALWGFAAIIEFDGRTLLFDTGSNGRILLANMAALGLAPSAIDLIFLSHPHWDHIGGLDSVLELSPAATVVVHAGFSRHQIADLRTLCGELIVVEAEPQSLAPGLFSTGVLAGEPPEHALILAAGDQRVLVSGCAHPSLERIVARAVGHLGRRIDWVVGGFHLDDADATLIDDSVAALRALGVAQVVPTHCTGEAAGAAFRRVYGPRCHAGGVGRVIELAPGG